MSRRKFSRRHFLAATASGAAGLPLIQEEVMRAAEASNATTAPACTTSSASDTRHGTSQPPHPMSVDSMARVVVEAPRRTRIAADVDVLVVGGGPAGMGAALAAAREGARTLLIERYGMLGGVWTAGLLNPFFDFERKGWLVAELVRRLGQAQAWRQWKFSWTFDPEVMKRLLETMVAEAGAEVWYYSFAADTIVEQGRVRGVIVESKSGREAVLAKVVVDCTGDGDVAAGAGIPYQLGRMSDSSCQPMTLMFEISGIDDYLQTNTEALYEAMVKAIHENSLSIELPFGRVNYAPWIINLPQPGTAVVQATHVYQMNALDARQLTQATIQTRRQAHELVQVMQRIPGLEKMRLTQTAPSIGVREARHLAGRYRLDLEDLRAGRTFEDAITFAAFGVDIHEVKPGDIKRSAHNTPIRPYEIPYRCLLPEQIQGLLFAGRCISGTHEAHASYRVTGTCMAMGQAAGLGAALAAAENRSPEEIDGRALRRALGKRGVNFISEGA